MKNLKYKNIHPQFKKLTNNKAINFRITHNHHHLHHFLEIIQRIEIYHQFFEFVPICMPKEITAMFSVKFLLVSEMHNFFFLGFSKDQQVDV